MFQPDAKHSQRRQPRNVVFAGIIKIVSYFFSILPIGDVLNVQKDVQFVSLQREGPFKPGVDLIERRNARRILGTEQWLVKLVACIREAANDRATREPCRVPKTRAELPPSRKGVTGQERKHVGLVVVEKPIRRIRVIAALAAND